jgi:hypothetical protein
VVRVGEAGEGSGARKEDPVVGREQTNGESRHKSLELGATNTGCGETGRVRYDESQVRDTRLVFGTRRRGGWAKVTPGREAPVGPTRLVCGGSRVPYDSNIVKEEKKSIDAP